MSSSETAERESTTKYTTVEVVRPHKAKHHRRKVSVKEVVRSETTEIEVIRPKGQKEKKRKVKKHEKEEKKRGNEEKKHDKKEKRQKKSTKFSPKKYLKKATAVDCKKKGERL